MNKVAFVMSLWKRQKLFSNIIDDLNKQTYKNFDLFCWNNNADPEAIELVEKNKSPSLVFAKMFAKAQLQMGES